MDRAPEAIKQWDLPTKCTSNALSIIVEIHEHIPFLVQVPTDLLGLSARAAWWLESLGFAQVLRYTAGKADWAAYGLP